MECKGGAPLTNEIKIFKHCFMISPGLHTLSLLPTRYTAEAAVQPDLRVITHVPHLSHLSRGPDTRGKCPPHRSFTVPYNTANHPCPDNHFEDIRDANLIDSPCPSARLYFSPFIYCCNTHSASYDLILRPSWDNEECRF